MNLYSVTFYNKLIFLFKTFLLKKN